MPYAAVKAIFSLDSGVFYNTFEVTGKENVPKDGEACLMVFNHCNSLGDAIVLISSSPVRASACVKDTMFKIPVIGSILRMARSVPLYRRREYGSKSKDFNADTFKGIYSALLSGKCVMLSPEGVSRFVSYAAPFKKGIGFMTIETILRARDAGRKDFKIKILPTIISYTHREKFRSDVAVRYICPFEIDLKKLKSIHPEAESLKVDEVNPVKKVIATSIMELVEKEFHAHMITSPDWDSIRAALTAMRIHRPLGTHISLPTYFRLVYGWLEIFKALRTDKVVADSSAASSLKLNNDDLKLAQDLMDQMKRYQSLIDSVKVKDERFRRLKKPEQKPTFTKTLGKVAFRGSICALLLLLQIPGLIVWGPYWAYIKNKERQLLAKGPTWVDSIAETKMKYGFFFALFLFLISSITSILIWSKWSFALPPLTFVYAFSCIRFYEELVASSRSTIGLIRLYVMSRKDVATVLEERSKAEQLVKRSLKLFPEKVAEMIKSESGDDVMLMTDEGEIRREGIWVNFNLLRRRKKDWNELLRLADYCTMDYVE